MLSRQSSVECVQGAQILSRSFKIRTSVAKRLFRRAGVIVKI